MDQETMIDLLEEWQMEYMPYSDGELGVEALNNLCKAIGYKGHSYAHGSPLECFFQDNSDAIYAVMNWIAEQDVPEWRDGIEADLPEREEEEE